MEFKLATAIPVDRSLPLNQRSTLVTDVEVGDRIDVQAILGRPARRVKMLLTDAADTISWKQNNLQWLRGKLPVDYIPQTKAEEAFGVFERQMVEFWNQGAAFPEFSETGETITIDLTAIASLEITQLSLGTGSTFSILLE